MGERKGAAIELPLLDDATEALKTQGEFQRDLTSSEVGGIMRGVVSGLLTGQDMVEASVPTMGVEIKDKKGRVAGTVEVRKPIKASIGINCVLGNAEGRDDRIKLVGLKLTQKAGFAAKMALRAINLEGKAREHLRDPNRALASVLSGQLKERGIKLTGIGLSFTEEDALKVALKGEAL